MTVQWTAEAYADLDAIFAHIAQGDPAAGARVVDRVEIDREVRVLGVIHGKRRWPSTF